MASDQRISHPKLSSFIDLETATIDDLRNITKNFPLIDNHAHNILLPENAYGSPEVPFESSISEAQGSALTDHIHTSLCFMRAQKQLAEFFNCQESWSAIKNARNEYIRRDYDGFVKRSLEGIHSLLLDDGLNTKLLYPYQWHRNVVPECARIVRIEAIAADTIQQLVLQAGLLNVGMESTWEKSQSESFFIRFNAEFRNQVRSLSNDANVRGFKSVVCYRTGLDVGLESRKALRPRQSLQESELLTAFHDYLQNAVGDDNYRIETKPFNDYLVVAVCDVLEKKAEAEGEGLPIQFHCGFGDSDINLEKANPAYLQPLIEAYPNVDIVMLHGSYPYTREAGYLASVYQNAWLDIGGMFITLSRDAQENMLRQALESAPTSKIILSTDAHFFPETYWLGLKQLRESLENVLVSYMKAGDFTVAQAINIATDLLFWNSNLLYKLDEDRKYPRLLAACGRHSETSTLVNGTPASSSPTSKRSIDPTLSRLSQDGQVADSETENATTVAIMDKFFNENQDIKYVWFQWVDYTNTVRSKMMPKSEFIETVRNQKRIAATRAILRILQRDFCAPGGSATGQILFSIDATTLTRNVGLPSAAAPSATVQTFWHKDQPHTIKHALHFEGCPRWALQRQVEAAKREFDISILMGFEIEIIFMQPVNDPETGYIKEFVPITDLHSWCNMTYAQLDILPMIEEIVEALSSVNIHLPQFHAEAAPGQWEFVLPPSNPLKSVDTLYRARAVIGNIAKAHGLKATVYPRPFDFTCGSACHAHFSISNLELEQSWLAGILDHLPSILAFSLPSDASYERVKGGIWAGGEWVTWGYQNKETPLRKIEDGRFELKTIDGMSHAYFAMAALIAAGLDGVHQNKRLEHKDCPHDASQIDEKTREELGITTMLPNTLGKALRSLEEDELLNRVLGSEFIENYVATKRAESGMIREMGEAPARKFIMERY